MDLVNCIITTTEVFYQQKSYALVNETHCIKFDIYEYKGTYLTL